MVRRILGWLSVIVLLGGLGDWGSVSEVDAAARRSNRRPQARRQTRRQPARRRPARRQPQRRGGQPGSGGNVGGFVNLPGGGRGWASHTPANRRWGTPRLINGLIAMGGRWAGMHPGKRLSYGDVSLQRGGYFPPHQSHRVGVDVDMSLIGANGNGVGTTYRSGNYGLGYNIEFARLQRQVFRVRLILMNDRRVPGVQSYRGHDNHFHLRIY